MIAKESSDFPKRPRIRPRLLQIDDVDLTDSQARTYSEGRPMPKAPHRLRVGVRRSFHEIALEVSTEFFAAKDPLLHI